MVTHLAECDDCREVVATVVAAQEGEHRTTAVTAPVPAPLAPASSPSWRRAPGTWVGALAAAALLVFAVRIASMRPEAPSVAPDATVWSEVARVVGPARAIEARLSGLPAHVPLGAPTRSAGGDGGFAAQALAARLAERAALPGADAGERRAVRHVAAVAALLAGRTDDAIERLEAALAAAPAAAPERADLLADLAAAHGVLADTTTRERWTSALTAADQALTVDAAHGAARFNRALALERLGRREVALAAWRDIAADAATAAGWREEAARHARALVP
ncbi:MAG: hypothetical protein JNL48_09090 [Acidobacteria bacterium]|nr:hypothetical protein [Acidobacteriota bacterium]